MNSATLANTWGRRAITLPLYFGLFALVTATFPLLLILAALLDLYRGSNWIAVRVVAFFETYLACEVAGVLASFVLWLWRGPWTGASDKDWIACNRALQHRWGRALGGTAFKIFGIKVHVDADPQIGEKPILLFIRHASTADTILAVNYVSLPYNLPLRYVLKRELLFDPCLDIVGNRLPNVFVDRASASPAEEVQRVAALLDKLGEREGVLIYPEGTRFAEAKRQRIAAAFDEGGDAASAAYTRSLRSVLPPRRGGPSILLEHNPGLDIVICAHAGLEGSSSFQEFWNGGLVGSQLFLQLRSYDANTVPREPEAQLAWLQERWSEVDAFVTEHRSDLN